ncbi:MAG TPA: CPXCG motif-containing cysteine-rich protein [Steroidobacteraceae bacterium]|jgi:transposase-like protein|nr:CPXCG motif-containing cysteine-rich protein [Steroidobacteraceae bacterium]
MNELLELTCPYCGEDVELLVDVAGGAEQSYVEDCPVCCRPWQVQVTGDPEEGWNATLRTSDE